MLHLPGRGHLSGALGVTNRRCNGRKGKAQQKNPGPNLLLFSFVIGALSRLAGNGRGCALFPPLSLLGIHLSL